MKKKRASKKKAGRRAANVRTLEELELDPNNVAIHSDRNIAVIAHSVEELGAARSIVLDPNERVICGNGTVEAALRGGRVKRVRVIESDGDELIAVKRTDITPEQASAIALADNRSSDLHEYDMTKLQAEVDALTDAGFDMGELALSIDDIDEMIDELGDDEETEEPAAADDDQPEGTADEIQRKWKVRKGDRFEISGENANHVLVCGDSRNEKTVAKAIAIDSEVDLIHIDAGDFPFELEGFRQWLRCERLLVWGTARKIWRMWFELFNDESDSLSVHDIVWSRSDGHADRCLSIGIGRDPLDIAELLSFPDVEGGDRYGDVNPKPAALIEELIEAATEEGGIVFDPFGGIGTTIAAAENVSRCSRVIEVTPKNVAVALERMSVAGASIRKKNKA